MNSNNKQIRDVADVAAQIMFGQQPVTEKLHPNQQKLDVHEPEKDELTSDDFKKLRAGKKADVKKEEVESIDEEDAYEKDRYAVKNGKAVKDNPTHQGSPNYKDQPHHVYATSAENALKKHTKKEEVAEGFKFNSHERGAAERLKDMRKNEKEAEKMDKLYSAMRKKREQDKLKKEEVESIDEVKMADLPSTKVQGRAYGASKPEPHPLDVMKGPTEKQLLGVKSEKKKKFSEMVNLYQDGGMKSFMEALSKEEEDEIIDEVSKEIADYTMDVIDAGEYTEVTIGEEASQDEFNAEIEKAKAKSQGKVKAEVAKAAVQAVKQEGTEITDEMIFEVLENAGIDFESLNDYELQEVTNEAYEIIKERHMTDAEMAKREKIVKSMKKGLSGFKDRYGDRAKNVMYATANKNAMKS